MFSQRLLADSPHYYVAGWGNNVAGEAQGILSSEYSAGLVTIEGVTLANPKAIAAGNRHSLALLPDGSVVGWGANASGEAVGDKARHTGGPVIVNGSKLINVKSIAACDNYSLAVMADDRVVGWGNVTVPLALTNVSAVSAGASHCLALKADGTVMSWRAGYPPMGLMGRDITVESGQQEFIDMSNRVVTELGPSIVSNVEFWSAAKSSLFKPPFYFSLSNIVAIAACRGTEGDDLALRSDGTVVEWPFRNREDRLTIPAGLSNVTAIASGGEHCLALRGDGTIVAWGEDDWGQAVVPLGLTNVVAIAAGGGSSMALKSDGTISVWGAHSMRQSEIPAGLGTVVAIAAGGPYCLAIQSSSSLTQTNAQPPGRN